MGEFDFIRGVINPNIRPPANPQSATMADEPEQGVASIGGTGGGVIDLSFSLSRSIQRNHADEDKRVYDVIRVIASNPDGTLDPSHYIEVEVLRDISFGNGDRVAYAKPAVAENIQLVAEGLTRNNQK